MKKKTVWLLAFVFLAFTVLVPCSPVQGATKKPKLNIKNLNMTLGNEFRLRVYNLKKKQTVTYTSSNAQIVSVGSTTTRGKSATIKALSTGSATITAKVRRGKKLVRKLKCRVKVAPVALSIKFPKRTIQMNLSDRFRLDPIIKPNSSTEQPIFESDNPAIASVSCHGIVTALAPGKATITATLLSSGITATCTVEVRMSYENEDEEDEKPTNTDKPGKYEKNSFGATKELELS